MNLSALHQLRMQKEIMRHHHRSQHRHHDEHTALWDARYHPTLCGGRPIYLHQEEFVDERETYHRDKSDDESLDALVGVGEEEDEYGDGAEYRSPDDRDSKEHLQGDGCTQYLRQ